MGVGSDDASTVIVAWSVRGTKSVTVTVKLNAAPFGSSARGTTMTARVGAKARVSAALGSRAR